MTGSVEHWCPAIGSRVIDDLQRRLLATRYPTAVPLSGWSAGTSDVYLKSFVDEWSRHLAVETVNDQLRSLPSFRIKIGGVGTYYLHYRSNVRNPIAVVVIHGWPSTVHEYAAAAEKLATQGFDVIAPALPGFPFSDALPSIECYAASEIAARLHELMIELGYSRYVVSGGDIGARVATWMAARNPGHIAGIHVSANALEATSAAADRDGVVRSLQPDETAWIDQRTAWAIPEGAYMHLHQTKPTTLGPALSDSPAALASWVIEKWQSWSPVDVETPERRRHLASMCTHYWVTNSGPTSILPYNAYENGGGSRPPAHSITVPVGFYLSHGEIGGVPPQSLAQRRYDLRSWTLIADGGHFPALDATSDYVEDLVTFAKHVSSPTHAAIRPGVKHHGEEAAPHTP